MEEVETADQALRREAFTLLGEVVAESYREGRRSYGASLKPALMRRTYGGFSEARLRYSSFGAFLTAAEQEGVISLHPAPRGPDREATPPGKEPIESKDAVGAVEETRVRADLWDAFMDWDPGLKRVYDRSTGRAQRFPESEVPLEPPELSQLRAQVAEESERFAPIDPISLQQQLEWMAAFVASEAPEDAREPLRRSLEGSDPARAFSRTLHRYQDARARWRAFRDGHVHEHLNAWLAERDIDDDIFENRTARTQDSEPQPPQTAKQEHTPAASSDRLDRLRATAHRAIDLMPEGELLALRIPLEYVVER